MERQNAARVQKPAARVNHVQRKTAGNHQLQSAQHPLVELQRSIGNQATQRLISSHYIQTKLQVSTPGDPFEQEADRVADTVMRMPDTVSTQKRPPGIQTKPLASQITPLIHRQVARKPMEEEEEVLSTKPILQLVPLAVRDDEDEEEKVAREIDTNPAPQEEEKEKTVAPKLESAAPIQRQSRDEDKDEETPSVAPAIQRQMEEEDEELAPKLFRQLSPNPVISVAPQRYSSNRSLSESKLHLAPIQRVCTECEDEIQRQPETLEGEDESVLAPTVQRQATSQGEAGGDEERLQMRLIQRQPEEGLEEETIEAQTYPSTRRSASSPGASGGAGATYEQDADRVANTIMRMAEPNATAEKSTRIQAKPLTTSITPLVQREPETPSEDDKEETIATKPVVQRVPLAVREDDEEEKVAAKLDISLSPQEEEAEEDKTVATKLATDAPLQRQTPEDDEKEGETLQSASAIQRKTEDEIKTSELSGSIHRQLEDEAAQSDLSETSCCPTVQRLCSGCEAEEQEALRVNRRSMTDAGTHPLKNGKPATTPNIPRSVSANIRALQGRGSPLPASVRAFFEPRFGADFNHVRVHVDRSAAETVKSINAKAFTIGRDIAFGSGQYVPESTEGRRLLAHELTHTLQQSGGTVRRQTPAPSPAPPSAVPPAADSDVASLVTAITQAVKDGNVGAAVSSLRGTSQANRASLRTAVKWQNKGLEHWFSARLNRASTLNTAAKALTVLGAIAPGGLGLIGVAGSKGKGPAGEEGSAEEGLRLLWPVVPLIDRLEVYDEGYREIEKAQLDVIRAASVAERTAARAETKRLNAIYAAMDIKEEYDARLLIDPEKKYEAAERVLERAPGVISDDEDLVFDAIWALTPAERRRFYKEKTHPLQKLLSADRFKLLGTLAMGTEAQALMARLREATEGRLDDQEAIRAVVDRAVALLAEQKSLRATLAVTTLPQEERSIAKERLDELGDLEALVKFGAGKLDPNSFLGRLSDAADSPDAFGAITQKLGTTITDPTEQTEFAFRAAKQRVLMAASATGANEDSIRNAILELRAPPIADAVKLKPREREQKQAEANAKLRQRLIDDKEVKDVINTMPGSARTRVRSFVNADPFIEKLTELTLALNNARWGEFFQIVLEIALRDDWRTRFEDTSTSPFDTFARVHGEQRVIMLDILKTQRIPTDKILGFTGNVEVLRTALANMDENERGQLRVGYLITKSGRKPSDKSEQEALAAFQKFNSNLRKSQTTLGAVDTAGIEAVLDAALGAEPTPKELASGAGRYNAAALMFERQQARLALGRGASAHFTETDETMVAAAREFAARWLILRERTPHELTTVELAVLSALHDRFNTRSEEFAEASNTAGEVAGMIAATIAGIIIVAGTGGVTAPAVIAAAAAGATARVVTREMFGEDYYNPAGGEGARDALLGAIDGALAVIGASLGAKGAELLGLGGKAFLTNAARIGGEVAEQASAKLAHRVIAGGVEAAIDGAFSGFVSEAVNAMTDAKTWRRGVWAGLVRVGQAALIGGLTGLAAGGVMGAALPVIGAGLKSAADRILGASVERSLAKAGASETLEAARAAMRAGNTTEAERLFAQLEKHLSPEQANVLWRDLRQLAEAATRLEEPITLLGQRHTLRLVEGEQGAFFVLCSWCTRVRDILKDALDKATKEGGAARIERLKELIGQVEQMEANFVAKKTARSEANSVNTMRSLLRKLTEAESLIGKTLSELPARSTPNFSKLARDPAVALRAQELYEGYLEQLWNQRRDIFGKKAEAQLFKELEREAEARALTQAQHELHGKPFELAPGAQARSSIDPAVDIPFGFYDRAGFDKFSQRLNGTLGHVPDAQLIVEGSAATGRRFERIAAPHGPAGTPFGLGRLSDYDIAIISDSLFQKAKSAGIALSGESKLATKPLSSADLAKLGLSDLDAAARAGILDATGIAYPVNFKIRPTSAPKGPLGLPVSGGK